MNMELKCVLPSTEFHWVKKKSKCAKEMNRLISNKIKITVEFINFDPNYLYYILNFINHFSLAKRISKLANLQ